MMLTAALTLAWGCSSDSDDAHGGASFTAAEQPAWTVDWTWHDEAPNWKNPAPTLHESRMYVVLKLDERYGGYSTDADSPGNSRRAETGGQGGGSALGQSGWPGQGNPGRRDNDAVADKLHHVLSAGHVFCVPY